MENCSSAEKISTSLGFLSIGCWLLVMTPQLYRNCKKGSAEDVSTYLLLFWLLGDTMNTIGIFLTNQLLFQKISCILFITVDVLALSQKLYYYTSNNIVDSIRTIITITLPLYLLETVPCVDASPIKDLSTSESFESSEFCWCCSHEIVHDSSGVVLGYLASMIYICSRFPQILKLRTEKKTNLPASMFMCAILGNITYISSILINTTNVNVLITVAPWLLCSICVMTLDCVILYHVKLYYIDNRIHDEFNPL